MMKLEKSKVFITVDWRRWTFGVGFNKYYDDWKIYLPVVCINIWISW